MRGQKCVVRAFQGVWNPICPQAIRAFAGPGCLDSRPLPHLHSQDRAKGGVSIFLSDFASENIQRTKVAANCKAWGKEKKKRLVQRQIQWYLLCPEKLLFIKSQDGLGSMSVCGSGGGDGPDATLNLNHHLHSYSEGHDLEQTT